jgi:hypothetical protein
MQGAHSHVEQDIKSAGSLRWHSPMNNEKNARGNGRFMDIHLKCAG